MYAMVCFINKWYCWTDFLNSTVTADHYLSVLQEEFLLCLQGMGVSFRKTFFQQDRASYILKFIIWCA
jgi:hypothetical protein